jgi:hypothetical protein
LALVIASVLIEERLLANKALCLLSFSLVSRACAFIAGETDGACAIVSV